MRLNDALGEAAGQAGAVGLHIQLRYLSILDEHGEAFAADGAKDRAEVELQLKRLGQLARGVRQHANLHSGVYTICSRSFYPFHIEPYYIKWVKTSWTLAGLNWVYLYR